MYKEYKFRFTTVSKGWRIFSVVALSVIVWVSVISDYWFTAGFASCAVINSVLEFFSVSYESKLVEEEK